MDNKEGMEKALSNVENAFNGILEVLEEYDCTLEVAGDLLEIYSDVALDVGHDVRESRVYDSNDFV